MMKHILILSVIMAIFAGCSSLKKGEGSDTVTLTGQIRQLEMTTFQYGTHLIRAGSQMYALKSSKVDLSSYVDKHVMLKGSKVAGYPLEGGPELIEVSEVSVK